MKRVIVGSKNPVKIECVRQAFTAVWPDEEWVVEGIEVDSGVSDQPMTVEESITGARNRAKQSIKFENADFGVGLEGGLEEYKGKWYDTGWIVVINNDGQEGIGSTVRMEVHSEIINIVLSGKELGNAIDQFYGGDNLKQKAGYFGMATNNLITRTSGYRDAVISALAPFINPNDTF